MRRPLLPCFLLALTFGHAASAQPAPPAPATAPTPVEAAPPAAPMPVQAAPPAAPMAAPASDAPAAPADGYAAKLGQLATVRFKPGSGAIMTTTDKRFSLALRTRMQLRYDAEIPHEEGEEASHVFQVRRARVQLYGHAFGEHNRFYIQLGLSPRDQTGGLIAEEGSIRRNPLRDARIELDYLRDLTVWLGQMKVPFSRQRVNSSGDLEMVDRALANEEMQLDRDLGVQVLSKDLFGLNQLAYSLGVFMGEGRNVFEPTDFGMLWVARAEWLPLGRFDDYTEGDLTRSARPGLSLGLAYAFHDNAIGDRSVHGSLPADGGTTDYHHVTADLIFKHRGMSANMAFHYRDGTRTPGDAVDDAGVPVPVALPRNGVGMLAQWSYMLPWFDLQIAARYAMVRNTDPKTSSLPGRNEATLGLGYYFGGHAYKVQVDYSRLWNEESAGDRGGAFGRGTDRFRAQVQLSL